MSTGSVPQHIVRPLQRNEFVPAYSTDELFRGVCHIVPDRASQKAAIPVKWLIKGTWASNQARAAKSRKKFLDNRDAIYEMLQTRGKRAVASRFQIGYDKLIQFLEEEKNAQN